MLIYKYDINPYESLLKQLFYYELNLNPSYKYYIGLSKRLDKYERIYSSEYNKELFNLQCWALTCESFFSKDEWKWIFKQLNFKNYYEFIYFS